jgi:2-polyprenyl-6-methoxyphenol hydroxylase-like FAD-dependent oxidoreductase
MAQLKILISGAGIAGTSLAFWLSKLGHAVTVIERFPELRTTGLQLDLRGHGIEVMKRMGLEEGFRARMAPEEGLAFVDSKGKRKAFFPANKTGKGLQGFTTDWEIMRGDLCSLIHDASKDRVTYVFGQSIEKLEERDDKVAVCFADGKRDTFDLVVGADGQNSRTRKMLFGTAGFHPLSEACAYFTIPDRIKAGDEYVATIYVAPGSRSYMTRRHREDRLQVYMMCQAAAPDLKAVAPGDVAAEKAALATIFAGVGWRNEQILAALPSANDFYCERLAFVRLDGWSRGRVALVGDAAYCPSANTGMGTTSSVVGAYILAGEIGRHCSGDALGISQALEAYEERFKPFMKQVQRGLKEGGGFGMFPSTSFGVAIFNNLIGIASFLKLNLLGEWILREKVDNWELPEYRELFQG